MKREDPDSATDVTLRLFVWLETRGERAYGEDVTQLQHALQCAELARAADAPASLVVAALLHDIGHLVNPELAFEDTDDRHEAVGARVLREWFAEAVVVPVALHVRAKRYLVTVHPRYAATLSPASKRSLAAQGGPLTRSELARFESLAFADAAIALRRWDDAAKVRGRAIPPLSAFFDLVANQVRRDSASFAPLLSRD